MELMLYTIQQPNDTVSIKLKSKFIWDQHIKKNWESLEK